MKPVNLLLCLMILLPGFVLGSNSPYTDYVNPFIGTAGHGHTFPGATTPMGLVQVGPDTGLEGWDWSSGYHYSDNSIMGFSHTHLSGTGVGDLADVMLMPTTGDVDLKPGSKENPDAGYRSRFEHSDEKAEPGYYSVLLKDYNIKTELTATGHCGMHKYTFPENSESNIIIDLFHGIRSYVMKARITVVDNRTIVGYRISSGWADLQPVYFVMKFSRPFDRFGTAINNNLLWGVKDARNAHTSEANIKGAVRFDTKEGEEILVKVGISTTSIDNARENLEAEMSGWNFEDVRRKASAEWEKQLSKIRVTGKQKDKEIFYTALYHSMVTPNQIADVDGSFIGPDDKLDKTPNGKYYSTFSLWDTYRAAHPLYTLLIPDKVSDMINTMLLHYKKWGYLPIWSLWGQETHVMIGNHAIPVIVDAWLKGIDGFDEDLAYEAIKTSSTYDHNKSPFSLIDEYGYIPRNKVHESVSILLEISYDDWCVAQMARKMGKEEDYQFFSDRSKNYKNIFDESTGFMRGKDKEGNWVEPFDPLKVERPSDYTEGNAWQYTWYVPHDPQEFINLYGGVEEFSQKLDTFFHKEKKDPTEVADVTGMIGQYAHGNEPSHHIAYFYNFAGQPSKTQKYVNRICNEKYGNKPEGLSGNEDCGQMSSWYLFSAMGFYPFNPASGNYQIGTPRFEKVELTTPTGNVFTIKANNLSDDNYYIQSVRLNGKKYDKTYITHQDILKGGTLEFEMTSKPGKWDVGPGAASAQ